MQTQEPNYLSSHRYTLNFEQKLSTNSQDLSAIMSFRTWSEVAYAHESQVYSQQLLNEDSDEFALRDFYLQYQGDNLFLRVGNQQVVWGESFGFFYSDIVNPKDLRDGGFGDISDVRRPIPMANLKLIFSDLSFQGIYIPKPYFDILPLPTSQFMPSTFADEGITNLSINRERTLDLEDDNKELGARISYLIGGADLSIFYLDHFDRAPIYEIESITLAGAMVNDLQLRERHRRMQSRGATLSYDFGGYLFRLEGLLKTNRRFPLISNLTLDSLKVDESVFVVSLDSPDFKKWIISAQYSQSELSDHDEGLFRDKKQSLVSLRAQRSFSNQSLFELLYSQSPNDQGKKIDSSFSYPVSDYLESKFGIELFDGPLDSEFGSLKQASKIYFLLKSYFKD